MTALVFALALLAPLAWALERNHHRRPPGPRPRPWLNGSGDTPDRDAERTAAELWPGRLSVADAVITQPPGPGVARSR